MKASPCYKPFVWLMATVMSCDAHLKDVFKTHYVDPSVFIDGCRWLQVNVHLLYVLVAEDRPEVKDAAEIALASLHKESETAFTLWKKTDKEMEYAVQGGRYVIFFQDDSCLETLHSVFRSGGEYTLWWMSDDVTSARIVNQHELEEQTKQVLRWLWTRHSILQATVVRLDKSGNWFAATFDPFAIPNGHGSPSQASHTPPSKRGRLRITRARSELSNVRRKFTRYLRNLRGYPVCVSVFPYSSSVYTRPNSTEFDGREIDIVNGLSEAMGFSIDFVVGQTYGVTLPNGTVTETLHDVNMGLADISINSREIRFVGEKVSMSWILYPSKDLKMYVLVPRARELPSWSVFFWCFSWEVWSLLAATTVVSGWAWHLLRSRPATLASSYVGVAHAVSSMAWTGMRRLRGVRERVLFVLLLFLSVVLVVAAFVGVLVKFFASPPRYPEIDSISSLDASGLRVEVISLYFRQLFRFREAPQWERMDAKVRVNPMHVGEHLDAIKAGDPHGFVAHDRAIAIFRRLLPAKMRLLHIVPVSVRTIIVSYIYWSNSPYRERFNAFFGSAVESGLMRKWDQRVMENYLDKYRGLRDDSYDTGPRRFSLEQLEPAFVLFALGCCTSVLSFIGEHLFKLLFRRSKRAAVNVRKRIREVVRRGRTLSVKFRRT